MARLEVTGKIESIGNELTFPSKNGGDFTKRELVVNLMQYDRNTGEPLVDSNPVLFEFNGHNTGKLNGYNVGDMVTVAFSLRGFYYMSKTDNSQKQMNKIEGYDIVPYQSRRQQTQHPVRQGVPQAAPAGTQQQSATQPPLNQQAPVQGTQQPKADDLPFDSWGVTA